MRTAVRRAMLLAVAALSATVSPGETVSIHGRKVFFHCTGSAPGPTVVLEAGMDDTSRVWKSVQPEVAHFARVCSYDRAGLGNSEPSARPQTADQIVEGLHAWLLEARIQPPYILVGHSIGGIYIRRFEKRYPEHVAGMVFVDSAHEEQVWRLAEIDPAFNDGLPGWRDLPAREKMGYLPRGAQAPHCA
jgi:pimeloyl-ACP methyl ester carboxylesterase